MTGLIHLLIQPASGGRFEHRLAPGTYVLGREESTCDLPILSPEVSRRHVALTLGATGCEVEDLGSTSGTYFEDERLSASRHFPYPVDLRLGTVRLRIEAETVKAPEAAGVGQSGGLRLKGAKAAPAEDAGSLGGDTLQAEGEIQADPDAEVLVRRETGVAGHYMKGKEIARGGMGAVLEANDQLLGRTVAMKVIRLELGEQESTRLRFIREATVLARLEHPNIIPIHEMGKDAEGRLFYTMKRVEGRTLQAILDDLKEGDAATVKDFSLDRLLGIFRKICDAIAFAHARGVIHRDLKPENVMVGAFGEVLVMDWGLAKILHDIAQTAAEVQAMVAAAGQETPTDANPGDSKLPTGFEELTDSALRGSSQNLTLDGSVLGSPQYMPPEQARGEVAGLDERSDVFSLGGILYTILTLRPPVEGRTVQEVLGNVMSGNITPPTHFNPSSTQSRRKALPEGKVGNPARAVNLVHCPGGRVPASLSAVCLKALAMDPEDRYPAVRELGLDIEAYQGGFGTQAEALGALGHLALFVKRHRAAAAAVLAGLVLVAGLTAAFLFQLKGEATKARAAEGLALDQSEKAAEAEQRARKALGDVQIALAEAAYRNRDLAGMSRALADCPVKLRNQTWEYLAAKRDESLGVLEVAGVTGLDQVLALSGQAGKFVVSGREEDLVVADLSARMIWARIPTGIAGSKVLALSGNGQRVAVAARNGEEIRLLDTKQGELLKRLDMAGAKVSMLDLNGDGTLLAVGYVSKYPDGGLRLIDTVSSRVLWDFKGRPPGRVQFHPDGDLILVGHFLNRTLEIRQTQTGKMVHQRSGHIKSMALSPKGDRLALGTLEGKVLLVDPKTGRLLQQGKLHPFNLEGVAWAGEETLVTLGADRYDYKNESRWSLGLWNAEDLSAQGVLFGMPQALSMRMTLDGAGGYLVTQDREAKVWKVPAGLEAYKFRHTAEQGWSGCFASDSALLVSQNFSLRALDLSLPSRPRALTNITKPGYGMSAAHWKSGLVAQGKRTGPPPCSIILRKLEGLRLVDQWEVPTDRWAMQMDFDPEGRRLLVLEAAEGLKIRSTERGQLLHQFPVQYQQARFALGGEGIAALLPNNRTEDQAEDVLLLLDPETGARVRSVTNRFRLDALAVSPDGRTLATAGAEQVLTLWDAATLDKTLEFRAHDGDITALAIHPTEPVVASGSADGSVKFWHRTTGRFLKHFLGLRGSPLVLAFSPSGHRLSVDGFENVVRVFDTGDLPALVAAQHRESGEGQGRYRILAQSDDRVQGRLERGEPVDLIQALLEDGFVSNDQWRKSGTGVACVDGAVAYLPLPGNLEALTAYRLTLRFRAIRPHECLAVYLPLGDRATTFMLDGFPQLGFKSGLRVLDGDDWMKGSLFLKGKQVQDEQPHEMVITVDRSVADGQVSIQAELDGRSLLDWNGALRRVGLPPNVPGHAVDRVALWTYAQAWQVDSVRVQKVDR